MHEHNVRIRFIGYIGALSEELQQIIRDAELLTQNNTGLTLQLAINYGGRDEIVRTIRDITSSVKAGTITTDDITEDYVSSQLFTKEFSDVDLLIRPSSDFRISNFLLWQLAYAEFLVSLIYIGQISQRKLLLEAVAALSETRTPIWWLT